MKRIALFIFLSLIIVSSIFSISLDEIMKDFSADKCIQYLKERGITACPILGG